MKLLFLVLTSKEFAWKNKPISNKNIYRPLLFKNFMLEENIVIGHKFFFAYFKRSEAQ
jgi:hypothetical protein